jgi:hypothetical protein
LQVDYFFGKPVAEGKVTIDASTFDVAFKKFTSFVGTTDKAGHVKFEIKLPDYFVGQPLTSGNAIVKLDAKVIDTAEHAESLSRTYPVSDQPIRVSFLPEGGRLIPGVENKVFVAALYPDGGPVANCAVDVYLGQKVAGKAFASVKTNETGLAEFAITPRAEQFRAGEWGLQNIQMLGGMQQHWMPKNLLDLTVQASDAKGAKATRTTAITSEPLGDNVLLRLDKVICKGGDKLNLDVLTSGGMPTVYVDVVKAGQTMLTRWLDVKDGKASTSVDLPAHVFGTLEVHTYQILATGEVIRDARVVYVNPASELNIKVTPDRDLYLPGAKGAIRFEVTDAQGKSTPAALGVLIVDEAVYALQEIQPGLEKVFFTLQEELMKPQAQAVYKPGENLDTIILQPEVAAAKQQAAKALLSAVQPKPPTRWQVEPAGTRRQAVEAQLQQIAWGLYHTAASNVTVLVRSKKTKQWEFSETVFATGIKGGQLVKEQLNDPLGGGQLTLAQLQAMEPGFAPDKLAKALTQARMQYLFWGVINVAASNQAKWLKGGKWTFPADILTQAAKNQGAVNNSKDAWGVDLKLLKREAKEKNNTGQPMFEEVAIVSAGPDGKFGTADDIKYEPVDPWSVGWGWWHSGRRMANVAQQQLAWRQREGANRFGMFGGVGGGMPMAGGLGGIGMPGLGVGAIGGGGPPPAPMAARHAGATESAPVFNAAAPGAKDDSGGAQPTMRLREYFPETLLWQPALITDNTGRATLEVPFADSITTWRLSASASSRGGLLGGTTSALRVFQDFFVDLDLPVALTQNDEVAFPVAVYNYLKTPQTVTLELKREPWFDLIDEAGAKRSLTLEQGQVTAVRFRIKAKKVGTFPLTVEARGNKMSDAIKRSIEILPDGKPIEQLFTDRLKDTVAHKVTIPPIAIEDASRLYVKIYPGVMSQVMEGMEGMLRLPGG